MQEKITQRKYLLQSVKFRNELLEAVQKAYTCDTSFNYENIIVIGDEYVDISFADNYAEEGDLQNFMFPLSIFDTTEPLIDIIRRYKIEQDKLFGQ